MLRNLKPHTRRECHNNRTALTASLWTSLLFTDYCEMASGDQPRLFFRTKHLKVDKILRHLASKGPFKYAGATFDKLYIWVTPKRGSISNGWQLKTKWCSSLVPSLHTLTFLHPRPCYHGHPPLNTNDLAMIYISPYTEY